MNVEELVFNIYKEEAIGSKKFRAVVSKKYKLDNRQIGNIYARINNYQVKKYGKRIGKGSEIEFLTREECEKRASIMRTMKYQRRKEK